MEPTVRFFSTSVATNCATREPRPILIAWSLLAIRLSPAFCNALTGAARAELCVIPADAIPSKASPATVWTSGIEKVFFLLIVVLLGLDRRVARRLGVVVRPRPRRASDQAFLLIPPACLIAHLGSLPRFATHGPSFAYTYS